MERIYLDYAASAPVDPRVLRAMLSYFGNSPARHARQRAGVAGWGNPGSLHFFGQEATAAVDGSREAIARTIGADFREIIFTGSATEANNLALRGAVEGLRRLVFGTAAYPLSLDGEIRTVEPQRRGSAGRGNRARRASEGLLKQAAASPRVVVSSVEHESVLETARDLERDGVEVACLPVDRRGVVDLGALKKALNERTVLVSVMYANNEVGTVQPIREISEIVQEFRNQKLKNRDERPSVLNPEFYPLVHTDSAQAFQFLDCDVKKLGVDLMTLSAHKIYGPKGVGALFVKNVGLRSENLGHGKGNPLNSQFSALNPLIFGGGQEFGLRSGTENVPGIVGFAKAADIIANDRELWVKKTSNLLEYFWRDLRNACPEAELNDCRPSAVGCRTLPHILNVYFPNHEAQFLLTKLDLAGVAASSGSACRSRAAESSHVLRAMGHSSERARHSVRFSFGRPTTREELGRALKIIKDCL